MVKFCLGPSEELKEKISESGEFYELSRVEFEIPIQGPSSVLGVWWYAATPGYAIQHCTLWLETNNHVKMPK